MVCPKCASTEAPQSRIGSVEMNYGTYRAYC